ncbi:MAG: hypothetical protein HBSAPP03_26650 [Phycisphaerae bacterium]|nr:MAG: hypothetical protein HBSAPP03_26650 [Phycisphaerae bacterium]
MIRVARSIVLAGCLLGGVPGVYGAGADDFGPGVVLPANSTIIPIARAVQAVKAQASGATLIRLQLELEGTRWVYKGELGASGARELIRVMIDARSGALIRVRRETPGGGDTRTILAVQGARMTIRMPFAQVAAAASNATNHQLVTDVRFVNDGGTLVYKVTTHAASVRSEVYLNVTTGRVIRISTEGDDTTPPPSGGNGGNGGNGGTTQPPSGGSGGGTTPPPPPGGTGEPILTGQADVLNRAIIAAMQNRPTMGFIEAKFKRQRYVTEVEVLAAVPGAAYGTEIYVNPSTFATRTERELLDAGDVNALRAFIAALGDHNAITPARAMAAALAVTVGEVSEFEIGTRLGAPIYEIKVLNGARERSVKVHAVTGVVLDS